jgi:hypothetical protein
MANPLDQFLKDQTALRSPKKDVPLMLDESILPRGEVTYSPQNKAAGIPIKGAALNAQGKVTAPIQGIGVQGNKPIEQSKVEELKQIFKPAPVMPEPVAPTPAPTPEVPTKEEPKKEQGFDWKSLLPALAPLAVEGIMGTQAAGTAGEGAGIAAKYILDEEAKKEARKKEFENKLIEMQAARDLASIKASGKQKPLTTANTLPYVDENGDVRYARVEEALGEKKPTEKPKGRTFEEAAWLQKQTHNLQREFKTRKEQIDASNRFKTDLRNDKNYVAYKAQLENSQKAIEWLSQGKNIADIGVKKVFAKGLFGDVGNIAVQEAADVAGSPSLYSKYLTLKAKFDTPGVQFSDQDRADMMQFAQVIRDSVPGKMQALADTYVQAEKKTSGTDLSQVAKALTTDPKTGDTKVKVQIGKDVYEISARDYPEAVKKHNAKLYMGKK